MNFMKTDILLSTEFLNYTDKNEMSFTFSTFKILAVLATEINKRERVAKSIFAYIFVKEDCI